MTAGALPQRDARRPHATTRVICVGVGEIGQRVVEGCRRDERFEVVAAVDARRAGENVAGLAITPEADEESVARADLAILATSSEVRQVAGQAEPFLRSGLNVLTTCEGLVYPWLDHPEIAERLDRVAKDHEVVVLGCGVNPGFIMDALPVIVGSLCARPVGLRVTRAVELTKRRPQLSKKLGVGVSATQWLADHKVKGYGHRGLVESAHLCALGLGWTPLQVEFDRMPVVRDNEVVGVRESVTVTADDQRQAEFELTFEVDGADYDRLEISGSSSIVCEFPHGLAGDDATVARLMYCARAARGMKSGLRTPLDISSDAWL